jgi:hypothetical protein
VTKLKQALAKALKITKLSLGNTQHLEALLNAESLAVEVDAVKAGRRKT